MIRAFGIQDRVAVVTGAGAGLGQAIALGLAHYGAQVVADRDADAAQATADQITAQGQRASAHGCDISQSNDITNLFATVERAYGPVDVLVNNVGTGSHTRPEDLTEAAWQHVMNVNRTGAFLCAQHVEWGRHNVRVNAVLPCQFRTAGLLDVIDDPQFDSDALIGRFLTGIPIGRLGEPGDLVGPVVFLASDASAMVMGTLLPVDGGNLALNAGGSHTW